MRSSSESSRAIRSSNPPKVKESEPSYYDRLESIHFEQYEIQSKLDTLMNAFKENINIMNMSKDNKKAISIRNDQMSAYYSTIKDVYKGIKNMNNSWEGLYEDMSARHQQQLIKRNKEVSMLKTKFKTQLQMIEFEKMGLLEAQKSENFKQQQELLDQVNNLTGLMQTTKRSWKDNISDLELMIQEQRSNFGQIDQQKMQRVQELDDELENLIQNTTLNIQGLPLSSNREGAGPISTDRQRNGNNIKVQKIFSNINETISPIKNGAQRKWNQLLLDKSKEDSNMPSTKRSKDNMPECSGFDELLLLGKMKSPNSDGLMPSGNKLPQDGWDSKLEDEEESRDSLEVDQIEKALALLFNKGLLEPDCIEMYERINEESNDNDKDIQMNLFKEHIRLQMNNNKKVAKNMDFPLTRPDTNKKEQSNHNINNTTQVEEDQENTNIQNMISPQSKMIPQVQNTPSANPRLKKNGNKNAKNAADINLSDIMKVQEYSFVLESPLSNHQQTSFLFQNQSQLFQHVEKDDLLKADSLPISIASLKENEELLDSIQNSATKEFLNNGGSRPGSNSKNNLNFFDFKKEVRPKLEKTKCYQQNIKVIEELQETNPSISQHTIHTYTSSQSSEYLAANSKHNLYQDEMQLDSISQFDSKNGTKNASINNLNSNSNLFRRQKSKRASLDQFDSKESQLLGGSQQGISLTHNEEDIIKSTSAITERAPASSLESNSNPNHFRRKSFSKKLTSSPIVSQSGTLNVVNESNMGSTKEQVQLSPHNNKQTTTGAAITTNFIKKAVNRNNTFKNSSNSGFINSNNIRNVTNPYGNTLINDNEIENGYFVQMRRFNNSEPYIFPFEKNAPVHNFSRIVNDTVEQTDNHFLNQSFPPYNQRECLKKELKPFIPNKKSGNQYMQSMKTIDTADTAGFKNLNSNLQLSNLQNSIFKNGKGFQFTGNQNSNFRGGMINTGIGTKQFTQNIGQLRAKSIGNHERSQSPSVNNALRPQRLVN